MIADQIAHVSMLESAIPVRLRAYDHNGQPSVVATPAGTNGHLLNRRASWIATHAASMGTPTTMRFFTLYDWVQLKDKKGRYVADPLMDYERGRRRLEHKKG